MSTFNLPSQTTFTSADHLQALAYYEVRARELKASTEGVGTTLVNIGTGIVDTFGKVVLTFKSNMLNILKDTKRTELRNWHDSNVTKWMMLSKLPYSSFMNTKIPIPSGMDMTYMDAVTHLSKAYTLNDMPLLSQMFAKLVQQGYTKMQSAPQDLDAAPLRHMLATISQHEPQLKLHLDKLVFEHTTKDGSVPAKQVIRSTAELSANFDNLLTMEKNVLSVAELLNECEQTNRQLGTMFALPNADKIPKDYVEALAALTRAIAMRYDAFATTAAIQMAVEHNYVLSLDALFANR